MIPYLVPQSPVPPKPYFPNGDPNEPDNPPGARNTDSCLPAAGHSVEHNYQCAGPAAGDIVFRWINGSVCPATNKDPRVQVVSYNEDTYILRENVCVHWEAPFTYLLFGNRGALLIDTGATADAAWYPLRKTVDAIIVRWCGIRGRRSIPLTVVLTSVEHAAQNQGMEQFRDRPETTILAAPRKGAASMPGTGMPGKLDLGGRIVTVLPTPGTHRDGVTFYDSYTCLLFTGDLLYPGRIKIANDRDYVASLTLLRDWAKSHPVKWVMGGHIEMMFVPGRAYPRFWTWKPFERQLQMEPELIGEALHYASGIAGKSEVAMRADFHLLNRVGPDEQDYKTSPEMPNVPVSFWML